MSLWIGYHFGDRRGLFAAFLLFSLFVLISIFSRSNWQGRLTGLRRVSGQSVWLERPELRRWLGQKIHLYESEDENRILALAIDHPFDTPAIVVSRRLANALNASERVALLALLISCIAQKKRTLNSLFELLFQNTLWLLSGRGLKGPRHAVARLAVGWRHQTSYYLKVDDAAIQLLRDLDLERRALASTLWKLQNLEATQHQRLPTPLRTSAIVDLPERGRLTKNLPSVHFRLKRLVGSPYI